MEKQKEIAIIREYFSKGYNIGKMIPPAEYSLLQKQLALKALDKNSKNYFKYRALSLGYDTAIKDRGLSLQKAKKRLSPLQKLIDSIPKTWEKENDMEMDL